MLFILAVGIYFVGMVAQASRNLSNRVIVLVNATTVPLGSLSVAFAVTNDLLYSLAFAAIISVITIPILARILARR